MKRIVVAVTGASGAVYARRLLDCLCAGGAEVHFVISPYGRRLFADELDIANPTPEALLRRQPETPIVVHDYKDVGDSLASGSFLTDAMIVCPCSSNTLGDIASGTGSNLISRAAAVHLKEARRLIIVPREMPVSQIEIANMLRISQAGGIICPASPGFYMRPKSLDDVVDFVVGKLLDLVGVPHKLNTRWKQG
jgi:4-hydroxy-3-polyprenylbenzoate decarboxylase